MDSSLGIYVDPEKEQNIPRVIWLTFSGSQLDRKPPTDQGEFGNEWGDFLLSQQPGDAIIIEWVGDKIYHCQNQDDSSAPAEGQ